MLITPFHKTPIENWVVSFDILGWTLAPYSDAGISQFISEKAALHIVSMIKRAIAICAIPNGLQNVDVAYEVACDEQYFLSVEREDNTNTNEE